MTRQAFLPVSARRLFTSKRKAPLAISARFAAHRKKDVIKRNWYALAPC